MVNKIRGTFRSVAVKAPGFGDRRKAMLEDIAILTGGQVVAPEVGLKLDQVGLEVLGTARRIVVTKDDTTIIDGGGDKDAVADRVRQIRAEIENTDSDWDREKLQERLAKLAGGVCVIGVGAATEVELKERKHRIEDAVSATRAAIEEGIVAGGGSALVHAVAVLDDLELEGDEATGANIVRRAADEPLRWIAENAGAEGYVVVDQVREAGVGTGYNGATGEYGDLRRAGRRSTRSRSPAPPCSTPRRSRRWCSPPTPSSWRRRKRSPRAAVTRTVTATATDPARHRVSPRSAVERRGPADPRIATARRGHVPFGVARVRAAGQESRPCRATRAAVADAITAALPRSAASADRRPATCGDARQPRRARQRGRHPTAGTEPTIDPRRERRSRAHRSAVRQDRGMPIRRRPGADAEQASLGVAAVARRLGVATGTLRTWDRRYGLGPSEHVSGTRRRYTPVDLSRLGVMRRLMLQGVAASEAAAVAVATRDRDLPRPASCRRAARRQPPGPPRRRAGGRHPRRRSARPRPGPGGDEPGQRRLRGAAARLAGPLRCGRDVERPADPGADRGR